MRNYAVCRRLLCTVTLSRLQEALSPKEAFKTDSEQLVTCIAIPGNWYYMDKRVPPASCSLLLASASSAGNVPILSGLQKSESGTSHSRHASPAQPSDPGALRQDPMSTGCGPGDGAARSGVLVRPVILSAQHTLVRFSRAMIDGAMTDGTTREGLGDEPPLAQCHF